MVAQYSQGTTVRAGGRQGAYRILIVDDRPTTREILEITLQRVGYRPLGVASGEEALHRLDTESFDLVITDLLMPQMSGLELLTEIRRRFSITELPVVFLTVREEGDDLVTAMRNGANDYVCKPVNYPVLFARMESHLNLREQVRDLQRTRKTAESQTDALPSAHSAQGQVGEGLARELHQAARSFRTHIKPVIRRFAEDDPMQAHLHSITSGVRRMERVASGLMVIGRAESYEPKLQRVQISHLAESLWRELEQRRGASGVSLHVEPHLVANTDAWLVRMVLNELLDNARKFSVQDGVRRVRVGLRLQGGLRTYYVADRGLGLAMENVDRVFELFERLPEGQRFDGAGVGLCIVRKCIERLGGRAWVESEPGAGATFNFTLESDRRAASEGATQRSEAEDTAP